MSGARHADPRDGSFRRSLLRALLVGLAAMVVTALIAGVLTRLGPGDGAQLSLDGGAATEEPPADPSPAAASPAATETRAPEAPATETAPAEAPGTETPTAPATGTEPTAEQTDPAAAAGATVQVLDATGGGGNGRAEAAADVLRDLGYDVVVVNPARRRYARTTVVASPGSEAEAEALAERDDRFDNIGADVELSTSVDLHVIVGADWR